MKNDSKIIVYVTAVIATVAVILMAVFGVHYLMENPTGIVFSPDMKTFTIVSGGDYTAGEIANYMRTLRKSEDSYMRISNKVYCAKNLGNFTNLDDLMLSLGYTYIGRESTSLTMRCYYKDGHARWVRVEYDLNNVWSIWNLGDDFEYDLARDGYKNMD